MEHRRPNRSTRRHPRRDGRRQLEALSRFPLFATGTPAQLARIDSLTCELDVPAGRVLAREGEPATQVLFVTAGTVRATKAGETVGIYEPGSCIGGPEVATRGTFPATVTAETELTVLAASPKQFRSLLDIPAVARLAVAPTTGFEPAPAPVPDPREDWEPVGWLGFAHAAGDESWPLFAATVDGTRRFEPVARHDVGGLGA